MTAPVCTAALRATACTAVALAVGWALSVTPAAAQEPAPAAGTVPDTATVGIVTNSPPRAGEDSITTFRDVAVTVDLFANDVDPDGDPLSLMGATSAAHGVLSFAGSLATYTPDAGWSGVDGFTYLVGDGRGGQSAGQVRITVVAPLVAGPHERPPVGQPPVVVTVADVVPTAPRPPVVAPVELPAAVAAPTRGPSTRTAAPLGALPLSDTAGAAPVRAPRVVGAAPARPASLPFTGSSAGGLTGLGVGLTAAGFLLVLLGRPRRKV